VDIQISLDLNMIVDGVEEVDVDTAVEKMTSHLSIFKPYHKCEWF
jgi:hypothetical protein